MLKTRIIPCLDVADGRVVKGVNFVDLVDAGDPVESARAYDAAGADEICFLDIHATHENRGTMYELATRTAEQCFMPLTIGGGIRNYTDKNGRAYSALEVAAEYFRSGADKVSIGSDAVLIAEDYLQTGHMTGESAIESISRVYGSQAVVISVDPLRVYVAEPQEAPRQTIETAYPGPNGERYCWYQCTIKGGREGRPVDAVTLAQVCEKLGAGEILLNCIDKDGTDSGYDIELINAVKNAVTIPVIASSGAGCVEHFYEVFTKTHAESALAAGIFHRKEVSIPEVKNYLRDKVETRSLTSVHP